MRELEKKASTTGKRLTRSFWLFVGGAALWVLLWWAMIPSFPKAVLLAGKNASEVTLPLERKTDPTDLQITAVMRVGPLRAARYVVMVDDCLTELTINGKVIADPAIPLCNGPGKAIDLSKALHTGSNSVQARIRDDGGVLMFSIRPSASDPLVALLLVAGLVLAGGLTTAMVRCVGSGKNSGWLALSAALTGGVALRAAYMASTAYNTRAYDWDGHIEYIRYVATHLSMPPAQGGWEYYQPPLYYIFTGGWMRLAQTVGRGEGLILGDIRLFSLAIAVGSLLLCAWIASLLFDRRTQPWTVALFTALLAAAPGLVFFSSRITNDTLFVPVSLAWLGFLLRWWKEGKDNDWLLSCAFLGAGLLTKSNALPYLPIAGLCLVLRPGFRWKNRFLLGLLGGALITAFSGWFFWIRFVVEKETFIVGNRLNGAMGVKNTWDHLLAFNPFRILAHPYNDNWNDAQGRQWFWEYFYKSFVVGEWNFGAALRPVTLLLQLLRLLTLPVMAVGLWTELRASWRKAVPLVLTLTLLLGAAFAYRVRSPFSANQDFRFVPLVIVPAAYFLVRGLGRLTGPLRLWAIAGVSALLCTEALFLLLLCRG